MKVKISVSIDESLHEKVLKKAEEMGVPTSQVYEMGVMAVVDQKALLKHTGGLFKQLSKIIGDELTRREINEKIKT